MKRRPLLISKGWVQAVLLVVLFGFFVLGLLAYRTYMAKPPMPQRVVDPQGQVLYTAADIREGPAGLPAQRPHGVRLGVRARRLPRARTTPPTTCAARRTSSRRAYGGARSDRRGAADDRGLPHQPLRRAQRDAHADGAAGRGPPAARRPLLALLLRADDQARAAPERDHRSHGARAADGVLRLDGVGRLDRAPGPRLLLHEQLAAGAARRQQADGQRDRLVRALADRAARRDRHPLRRLRALAVPGLARPRAGDAVVPRARATSR